MLNRFYNLLLSPLIRIDDDVPSRLVDGTTGVRYRPKDRLRKQRQIEERRKRAERAAMGLPRDGEKSSRPSMAMSDQVGDRSSMQLLPLLPGGDDEKARWLPRQSEEIDRMGGGGKKRWSRETRQSLEFNNAPHGFSMAGGHHLHLQRPSPSATALHSIRPIGSNAEGEQVQYEVIARSYPPLLVEEPESMDEGEKHRLLERSGTPEASSSRPAKPRVDTTTVPVKPLPLQKASTVDDSPVSLPPLRPFDRKAEHRRSLPVLAPSDDAQRPRKARPRGHSSRPPSRDSPGAVSSPLASRSCTDLSPPSAAAPNRRALFTPASRTSLDSRAPHPPVSGHTAGYIRSRTSTDLTLVQVATRGSASIDLGGSGSPCAPNFGHNKNGRSISDLASAACKRANPKQTRKAWRDEVDKVAKWKVVVQAGAGNGSGGGSSPVMKGSPLNSGRNSPMV